ncbi:hypothetical protein M4578_14665 [Salipiger sp. P9]|uniref:hypothetical protein n=1 Tax=Salipiger pentaromativorans TaxID=2943193 RepID=UPI00215854DC|nr:hypothetical protein [Salipiger pentaromativorans]MCR8549078.1 hypothetical protein [Salipiger pentaromativorans]
MSPAREDFLASDPAPGEEQLLAWLNAAHRGGGTPWLTRDQAQALARYALTRGEGVRMMEAAAFTMHEPPRDIAWEILGADAPGENWDDHRDPDRAFALFQSKLRLAERDGARLQYKLWLGHP